MKYFFFHLATFLSLSNQLNTPEGVGYMCGSHWNISALKTEKYKHRTSISAVQEVVSNFLIVFLFPSCPFDKCSTAMGWTFWSCYMESHCGSGSDSDPYNVPAASILLSGGPLIWLLWLGSPSMASPIQLVPFSDNSLLTVQSRYIQ